jgi:hypothetical protein
LQSQQGSLDSHAFYINGAIDHLVAMSLFSTHPNTRVTYPEGKKVELAHVGVNVPRISSPPANPFVTKGDEHDVQARDRNDHPSLTKGDDQTS